MQKRNDEKEKKEKGKNAGRNHGNFRSLLEHDTFSWHGAKCITCISPFSAYTNPLAQKAFSWARRHLVTFLRSPRPCKVTAKISGRHPAHGVFGPTFSPVLWLLSIYLCKSHNSHERLPLLSHSKGRTTDSESDGVNPSQGGGWLLQHHPEWLQPCTVGLLATQLLAASQRLCHPGTSLATGCRQEKPQQL